MAVLVGIYLLDREHVEVDQDGQRSWVGSWTLFRLASGDRSHWESLSSGSATPTVKKRARRRRKRALRLPACCKPMNGWSPWNMGTRRHRFTAKWRAISFRRACEKSVSERKPLAGIESGRIPCRGDESAELCICAENYECFDRVSRKWLGTRTRRYP
jgi:hypothetical protein